MLNRTNLTLSALSNRLNLGTRSLVLATSANHGDQTLRIRHSLHDVMRDRMVWCVVPSFGPQKHDIPPTPDSIIPGPQQRPIRCACLDASGSACQYRDKPRPAQSRLLSQSGLGKAAAISASAFRTALAEA
jgi:hypothetical protein